MKRTGRAAMNQRLPVCQRAGGRADTSRTSGLRACALAERRTPVG